MTAPLVVQFFHFFNQEFFLSLQAIFTLPIRNVCSAINLAPFGSFEAFQSHLWSTSFPSIYRNLYTSYLPFSAYCDSSPFWISSYASSQNTHLVNVVPSNRDVYWWLQVPQIGAAQHLGRYQICKLFQKSFPEYYASCLLVDFRVLCLVDMQD